MALYAFGGTWNVDKPGGEHDTNVTADTHYNNPPDNVVLVDDSGAETGRFRRA